MPKQVDFYVIENQVSQAKFKLASRLASKLIKLKQVSLIITNDNELETLNNLMWDFSDSSFVAHDCLNKESVEKFNSVLAPHYLIRHQESTQIQTLEHFNVLINLATTLTHIPVIAHHFDRIVEVIENEESTKIAARRRFVEYQSEGFHIQTHPIQL